MAQGLDQLDTILGGDETPWWVELTKRPFEIGSCLINFLLLVEWGGEKDHVHSDAELVKLGNKGWDFLDLREKAPVFPEPCIHPVGQDQQGLHFLFAPQVRAGSLPHGFDQGRCHIWCELVKSAMERRALVRLPAGGRSKPIDGPLGLIVKPDRVVIELGQTINDGHAFG